MQFLKNLFIVLSIISCSLLNPMDAQESQEQDFQAIIKILGNAIEQDLAPLKPASLNDSANPMDELWTEQLHKLPPETRLNILIKITDAIEQQLSPELQEIAINFIQQAYQLTVFTVDEFMCLCLVSAQDERSIMAQWENDLLEWIAQTSPELTSIAHRFIVLHDLPQEEISQKNPEFTALVQKIRSFESNDRYANLMARLLINSVFISKELEYLQPPYRSKHHPFTYELLSEIANAATFIFVINMPGSLADISAEQCTPIFKSIIRLNKLLKELLVLCTSRSLI